MGDRTLNRPGGQYLSVRILGMVRLMILWPLSTAHVWLQLEVLEVKHLPGNIEDGNKIEYQGHRHPVINGRGNKVAQWDEYSHYSENSFLPRFHGKGWTCNIRRSLQGTSE